MPKKPQSVSRGRKPDANSKSGQIRALLGTNMSVAQIAKKVGCSVNLVYAVRSGGAGAKGAKRAASTRGASTGIAAGGLEGILAAVKNSERERHGLRAALERIQQIVTDAMS